MREILFRGRRVDNGEWVEGIFYQHPLTKECFVGVHDYNSYSIAYMGNLGCPVFNKVDPSTVGQYTGMNDRNDNRIFEGDIAKATFRSNHSRHTFQVLFENGMFMMYNGAVKVTMTDVFGIEVIGNIHDNPDLIGI